MNNEEIIKWCSAFLNENENLIFPEEIFDQLDSQNTEMIVKEFGKHKLMKLPLNEIKFFEWLKISDEKIWNDLWQSDEEPYLVSVNFLPLLIDKSRGFPICDLLENDNYYFSASHMVDEESKTMIESVQKMYMDKKSLTVEQTLVLEISIKPIDIWHFSYRYNLDLDRTKKAVANLVEEGILVHLKDAEHLAIFIEI